MKTGPAVGAPNHPHENRSATGYLINLFMAAVSAGRRGYDVAPTARSIPALGNAPDILIWCFRSQRAELWSRERQSPDWRIAKRQSGDWRSRVSTGGTFNAGREPCRRPNV